MRRPLHVFVDPPLIAEELVARQAAQPDTVVVVVDLRSPTPDYDALLEQIFAADSVAVW